MFCWTGRRDGIEDDGGMSFGRSLAATRYWCCSTIYNDRIAGRGSLALLLFNPCIGEKVAE
jgi:hypothetical protein